MADSWGLVVTAAPTFEPVSLDRARRQVGLGHSGEDDVLADLVAAARAEVETLSGRALALQTFRLTLDRFPAWEIVLPRAPVAAVSSVVYLDENGVSRTLSPTLYRLDSASRPARLEPAYGQTWPATYPVAAAVQVTFTAGHASEALIPPRLRAAVLLKVEQLYGPDGPSDDAIRALCTGDDHNLPW